MPSHAGDVEELHARVPDESLDIDENCVMVLKNSGRAAIPGWPKWVICRFRRSCCARECETLSAFPMRG